MGGSWGIKKQEDQRKARQKIVLISTEQGEKEAKHLFIANVGR